MNAEELKAYQDLIDAINSHNQDKIIKAKYDFLFYGSSLFDVVVNYLTLAHNNVDFDFGFDVIKKGTKLYRIRSFENDIDFSDPCEWTYPPSMPENRANHNGEPALYLGTTETVCLLETHIGKNCQYVLGEYIVTDDIKLGGFHWSEDSKNVKSLLAGVVLNAFLIAPSRNEKNNRLFDYLDNAYGQIALPDLNSKIINEIDLPFKFGLLNKKDQYYKMTNQLIEKIKEKYPEGLRYSSCYIPASTVGIKCSDSNIVIYKQGFDKIKFVKCSVKTNNTNFNDTEIAKLLVTFKNKANK